MWYSPPKQESTGSHGPYPSDLESDHIHIPLTGREGTYGHVVVLVVTLALVPAHHQREVHHQKQVPSPPCSIPLPFLFNTFAHLGTLLPGGGARLPSSPLPPLVPTTPEGYGWKISISEEEIGIE